jgi:hypothetical protein
MLYILILLGWNKPKSFEDYKFIKQRPASAHMNKLTLRQQNHMVRVNNFHTPEEKMIYEDNYGCECKYWFNGNYREYNSQNCLKKIIWPKSTLLIEFWGKY